MIEVTLKFETLAEAANALASLSANSGSTLGVTTTEEAPKPRKSKKAETAPTVTETPATVLDLIQPAPSAAAVLDPLAALGLPAAQLPPAATARPAVETTQQDLLKAFVEMGKTPAPKGGTDAIKAVLAKYGVAIVPAIPKDKWAEAIATIKAALA